MTGLPLRERKQQRAREQIIDAAYALFQEHGFATVTVTDIAARAEVGRTTFFRHFGDKQEVVFAGEQALLDQLTATQSAAPAPVPSTLADAVRQLQPIVLELCATVTGDARRYQAHEQLVEQNPELRDRQMRKLQTCAHALENILRTRGANEETAVLAAHIAGACFHTGRQIAGTDATALLPAVERAFTQLEHLRSAARALLP